MSNSAALLLLFVVLPLIVTPIVVAVVVRRSPDLPAEYRISALLDHGEPATAELLAWKNKGPFLLDSRPMVEYKLAVRTSAEPFELSVTQSTPRGAIAQLRPGMTLEVRLSADGRVGAIVLPMD